jgi:hypothetical protein
MRDCSVRKYMVREYTFRDHHRCHQATTNRPAAKGSKHTSKQLTSIHRIAQRENHGMKGRGKKGIPQDEQVMVGRLGTH